MVENWALGDSASWGPIMLYAFLELLLVFAVAFLLWFLLRWRKKSRCGAAQRRRDEIALTSRPSQAMKTEDPYVCAEIEAMGGSSPVACFGYQESYLSCMLAKIGLKAQAHNLDYIRGMSVYSLSAVANIGKLATGAYAYPSVEGWKERTEDNILVQSLSWDWVNETVPDVVQIVLTEVKMKPPRKSPTLQFSISWSTSVSETFTQATSTHPQTFCISKRISSVMGWDAANLRAKITYQKACFETGTIEFPPKPFNDIGHLQKNEIWTSKDGSVTLHVTLSLLEFSKICPEPPKDSKSSECSCKQRWDTTVPVYDRVDWNHASSIAVLCDLDFETCVYIDNQKSSTQCWIFRLVDSKTVAIAFRGTQTDRIYDCCVDLFRDVNCGQQVYDFGSHDPCILDLNPDIITSHLKVHRGFFEGYLSVRDIVLETVFRMTEGWTSDWSIVVTGHSLGASIAVLCGVELANRTLKGKRPSVSSLLLAPVRTGDKSFVKFYYRSIPYSYRVVNQVDYIGSSCLKYFYDHVLYEIHCMDTKNWTYALPDSTPQEKAVKADIVNHIKQIAELPGTELAEIPPELEDHLPGSYLFTIWQILKRMRKPPGPGSPQIEDVPAEEP